MREQPSAIRHQPSGESTAVSHQPSVKALGVDGRSGDQGVRVAFIAAIKEEVAPLVRGWKTREISHDGRRYQIFESADGAGGKVALICSGIGAEHGRRATEGLIREVRPTKVVSVGYAGALDGARKVGEIVEPRTVVNAADGSRTDTGSGQGTLVSYTEVADRDQKRRLGIAYGAIAVDMEGASAAQAARAHGIEFAAIKAISDTMDFAMPPVQKFVVRNGRFRKTAFAMHVAVRPWLWGRTIALAGNSARASRALCKAIEEYLEREELRTASPMDHASGLTQKIR